MLDRTPALYSLCLGIGLLGILGSSFSFFSSAEENIGLHFLYRWRGPEKPSADVIILAIDRQSARAFNLPTAANKWPRSLHARLLDYLSSQGAAVVAFDLIFNEPQPSDNDERFAAAMAKSGNVILTQPIHRQTMSIVDATGNPATRVEIEKRVSAIPVIGDAALGQAPFPLPKIPLKLNRFWRFSPGSGDVATLPVMAMQVYSQEALSIFLSLLKKVAPDGAANLPVMAPGGNLSRHIIHSISPLYALFAANPSLARRMTADLDRHPPPVDSAIIGRVRTLIALYSSGNSRYLNLYGPPNTVETISYHRLLTDVIPGSGKQQPELPSFKGRAVFVGQTESDWYKANDGFYTAFSTPAGRDISGVEIAATAFANLLEDKSVRPLSPAVNAALLLSWGVIGTLVSIYFPTALSAIGLFALNITYICMAQVLFVLDGTWCPLVVPVLIQSPAALIAGLGWRYNKANKERRNIRQAFGHYLPDALVERLAADVKDLRADGQMLYSICLFTDAESYTTLSEELEPAELTRLMNAYYEVIFKPIKKNGGIILQVIGDSVLSIWTAARPSNELKAAACRAAMGVDQAVRLFNDTAGAYKLPTRLGLHAGEVLLGNIGAMDHFEYRPVGDIVNTASRLEGLNKHLGTRMLTSEEALEPKAGMVTRPVGRFVFKGKTHPVQVHQILQSGGIGRASRSEVKRFFTAGLQAFELQCWEEAGRFFQQALELDENDGPAKFYIDLCRRLHQSPPDSEWNGAVHLTEK